MSPLSRPTTPGDGARVPSADRIPLLQKIMFSAGMNTEFIATGLMMQVLWMPYFNIGLGISPALLGIVLMILRAWDAITDPLIGNLSDNARTRWGRRRPFMMVGAVTTAVLYPLFWYMPAGLGESAKVAYLVGVGMVYFTCFSVWSMPYYGMQLELTPNYDERTRLASWMAIFSKISALGGGWVLAFVTGPLFINAATGKGDIVIGMKTASWMIAGAILLFGLLPALFVKERYYAAEASRQPKQSFLHSVRDSARSRPLWSLIGISFFLAFGYISIGTLNQYLNIYYVFGGDLSAASVVAGWRMTATVVTGIISIPLAAWLAERFDKKAMVIGTLVVAIIGVESNYFMMRPDLPYLQLIPGVLEVGAYSAMWLFLPSMKADVADCDELDTGRRREGSINAFYSWFIKLSLTCAMGVGGLVLHLSGFDAKLGPQLPEVLNRMFTLYLALPLVIWGVAIAIAWYYPLNRARMRDVRATLEARRGRL
jgi:GPH family glycoside/pentoside/hexuronide:cation symporter